MNEERSLALFVLLWAITLGIYPIIWLFRRRQFLDSLDSEKKLGMSLPTTIAVCGFGVFILAFYKAATHASEGGLMRLLQLATTITMFIALFRVANILRSDFNRTGRFLNVSSVMVFFFGTFYLQFKMNQAAHVAARKPKKKKKKPAPEAPVVDEQPEAATE